MASVLKELQGLRRAVGRNASSETFWRYLTTSTQPIIGLGLFALGVGISMVTLGLQAERVAAGVSHLMAGSAILLVGYYALLIPSMLQQFLVRKPGRLASFMKAYERNKEQSPLDFFRQWANRQGDDAREILRAIRRVERLLAAGAWSMAVALAGLVVLYLAALSLILRSQFGPVGGPVLLVLAVGLGVLAVLLWLRHRTRKA